MRAFGRLWKDAFAEWSEDKASRFAAALALYALMSLGPLMLLIVSVVGLAVGEKAAQAQIMQTTQGVIGGQGAEAIQNVLQNAHQTGNGVLGTVIGFALLVFGLTGTVGQMQTALDTMWEIQSKPHQGIVGMLRNRLFSLATLAGLLFLLLGALVITSAVTALTDSFTSGATAVVVRVVNIVVSLVIFTAIFAFTYRVVPQAKVRWRDAWLGGVVTAILFTIGKELIGLYLGHSKTSSYFGAAGSLVVLVVWMYYAAQIFFLGAEFTQVYANRYGGGVHPEEHAEAVPEPPEDAREGAGAEAQTDGDGATRAGTAAPAEPDEAPPAAGRRNDAAARK